MSMSIVSSSDSDFLEDNKHTIMHKTYKIFFHMMDLVGPQNACIGLGQELLKRGHQIHFVINEEFAGNFSKYGFVEHLLRLEHIKKETKTNSDPIKEICKELVKEGMFEPTSSLEKLKSFDKMNFLGEIYDKCVVFEPQIKALLESESPDVIIIDSDIVAPCLIHNKKPYVYIFCCNPLGLFNSNKLPPFTSGYAIDSDPRQWEVFKKVQQECHYNQVIHFQNKLFTQFGYPIRENQVFTPISPYLTLYQFPQELDYDRHITIPKHFIRVDAFCRFESESFQLPQEFKKKIKPGDKLIYLSMGSMGSVHVKLMKRLVSILAKTPHRYIVSKGLLHDEYELADNMWGEAKVPQTQVLPLVDLFITHGGNNSLTEAFTFGKPLIVMPLFYDQFDNAKRVQETGYGIKVDPYNFEDHQLVQAIEQLLSDEQLILKYRQIAERIRKDNRKQVACDMIEQLIAQST